MSKPDGAKPHRIDVHHHFFPPEYLGPLTDWAKASSIGMLVQNAQKNWSLSRALEEMDRTSLATAVLSISTPGVWFGDQAQARRLARICNEYAARLGADHKGRFGSFASVPMPDVEGTLAEIAYAFDTLGADGIGMTTSYPTPDGDRWPGHSIFDPVFAELDRRKAIVYFHPLSPACCSHMMDYLPASVIEVPHDTTRAVSSLLFSGSLHRWKNIRWIFSHAGAGVPVLAGRMMNAASRSKVIEDRIGPNGIEAELRKLYYDTANAAYKPTIAALLALVPVSQVLLGTDYPYLTVAQNLEDMDKLGLTAEQRAVIERANALRLFPRLDGAI